MPNDSGPEQHQSEVPRNASLLDRLRASKALPFVILVVSLTTTAISWHVLRVQGAERAQAEFETEARQAAAEIREEIRGYEEVLQAGAGLIAASDSVSQGEWARFVDRLDLSRAYPGITSINYAKAVDSSGIPGLVARMRAEGSPSFAVWPEGSRGEYIVNTLVEPSGGTNARALGFDMATDPTRRRALEDARDSGRAILSARIGLVSDRSSTPNAAFLLVVPVFRDALPETLSARRAGIMGYVTAAFALNSMINGVLNDNSFPLGASIWEGPAPLPDRLMFTNARGGELNAQPRDIGLTTQLPIALPGQVWTVQFTASRSAAVALQGSRHLLAVAAGIPLSLLLFGIAWSESALRSRATSLAREMTREVRKQAQLLDLTHDAVFLRDPQNVIRYWNRAAADTYGYTAEEAIGRTADDLLRTKYPMPLAALWEQLTREDRWEGELVHTCRNGDELIVASRWSVQRSPDRRIESVLETNNDITDRRRAEEDRRRLEASLLQAQKLEAMGTLAGGVAHDFNNILGAVLGYGELAQNAAAPGSALRRYVDNMVSAGLRAKSLVERILAFSRSGVGPRTAVHVQSVVAEALELLTASLAKEIEIVQELHAQNAAVLGDATQIHQVVLNLCTNAIQAMQSRGTLTVRLDCTTFAEEHPVKTGTLKPGQYVCLSVSDTGAGIDPALHDRIFDPFFTTKGVGVGTGLGLSLVHGIVIALGGGVDMESEVGHGSTFTVFLPRQGEATDVTVDPEPAIHGNGEVVLIVDDEEMLVRLAEETLAGLGYEPVGFNSPIDALEAFRKNPQRFDAVLSDETMPGMTGTQFAEQISSIRPDIPIILMSGYAGPTLAARARSAGARDVLAKPLQSRDIATALSSALTKLPRQ